MTRTETEARLHTYADPAYKAFQSRLVPGLDNLLGVRTPALRALAREIAADDWRAWLDDPTPDRWNEETTLRGMVIALAQMDTEERLARLAAFVPRIINWAVCDSLCATLKFRDKTRLWDFLAPYLATTEEFPARFGAVMLLTNFVAASDLDRTLSALSAIPAPGYNARMGVAWALSVCGVRFPDRTLAFLDTDTGLDDWTHNKALQKMLDSRRLPDHLRPTVRACKRRPARGRRAAGTER